MKRRPYSFAAPLAVRQLAPGLSPAALTRATSKARHWTYNPKSGELAIWPPVEVAGPEKVIRKLGPSERGRIWPK